MPCRERRPPSTGRALRAALIALLAAGAPDVARALVASCEDGSVVLAQRWADVRCEGAMQVDPDDLALGVHHSRLPDVAALRRNHEAARERDLDAQLARIERQRSTTVGALPLEPAERRTTTVGALPLEPAERRLLARLFSGGDQGVALARDAGDEAPARLWIVYSPELEARVRRAIATSRPIVVFALEPVTAARAGGLPSFAQRGVTFRPRLSRDVGWLGAAGERRLGYVALPAGFDPALPMALFWGDAVAAARLAP